MFSTPPCYTSFPFPTLSCERIIYPWCRKCSMYIDRYPTVSFCMQPGCYIFVHPVPLYSFNLHNGFTSLLTSLHTQCTNSHK